MKRNKSIFLSFLIILTTALNHEIAFGQVGKSLLLNGFTNHFEIPENDALDNKGTLSIECWVRPNCSDVIIVSKQWCSGQYSYYFRIRDGQLYWNYSNTGVCSNGNSSYRTKNTFNFDNKFTHVAVTHSPTDIKLFINGVEQAGEFNLGAYSTIHNSNLPLLVGGYKAINQSISNHYSGLIDELRIWNTALTESKIKGI
ncbi:MAG: hypothetical protein ACI8ZN_002297 [Bacteroidia bacterium]|jgi:hypothetical protein